MKILCSSLIVLIVNIYALSQCLDPRDVLLFFSKNSLNGYPVSFKVGLSEVLVNSKYISHRRCLSL